MWKSSAHPPESAFCIPRYFDSFLHHRNAAAYATIQFLQGCISTSDVQMYLYSGNIGLCRYQLSRCCEQQKVKRQVPSHRLEERKDTN